MLISSKFSLFSINFACFGYISCYLDCPLRSQRDTHVKYITEPINDDTNQANSETSTNIIASTVRYENK
jgi:hypothetical protein